MESSHTDDPVECHLCGSRRLEIRFRDVVLDEPELRATGRILLRNVFVCRACGTLSAGLPPAVGDDAYYAEKPADDHQLMEDHLHRFDLIRDTITRLIGRESYTLLDVGCAGGAHLTRYPECVSVFGVEPSESGGRLMAERGLTRLGRYVQDISPEQRFDVVTSIDVIEHLEQPGLFIESLTARVDDGGLLAILTGDAHSVAARWGGRRWEYWALPEHCTYFSAPVLDRYVRDQYALTRVGKVRVANEDLSFDYVRRFLRATAKEGVIKLLPKETGRRLEREGRAFFPFFYDSMLLVFRRA